MATINAYKKEKITWNNFSDFLLHSLKMFAFNDKTKIEDHSASKLNLIILKCAATLKKVNSSFWEPEAICHSQILKVGSKHNLVAYICTL